MIGRFDAGELAAPANPWGTTVVLSLGLHVFGLILAFGVPRLLPRPAIEPVYIVDLVSLPGGPAAASLPPAAPSEPAKSSLPPVPKEEKAIPIPDRNKKPTPKKTPVPKSTPAKPKATATPVKSSEPPSKTAKQTEDRPQPQGTPAHGASMSGVTGASGASGGGFGGSGAAQADLIQIEGNIIQTVSRTLKEELKWNRSRVTSVDWNSYPILRFPEVPEVDIVLLDRPNDPAWGAGEPSAAVVPSAISNAIFDAIGARMRTVPFTPARVKAAMAKA